MKVISIEKELPVPPPPPQTLFTVELTQDEVVAIYALTGRVGGASAQRDVVSNLYRSFKRMLDSSGTLDDPSNPNNRWHLQKTPHGGSLVQFTNPERDKNGLLSGPDGRIIRED